MKLILFVHQDSSEKGAILKSIINKNFKRNQIQTIQTFNEFKIRLEQISIYDKEIFILLADSKNRLKELVPFIGLLNDRRTILILPDKSKLTVSIAHQFFPRFFTYISNTYRDLCAVLTKMTHQGKSDN